MPFIIIIINIIIIIIIIIIIAVVVLNLIVFRYYFLHVSQEGNEVALYTYIKSCSGNHGARKRKLSILHF